MTTFFHHRPVVNILRLIWVFAILFYEYGVFIESVRRCSWPDSHLLPEMNEGNTTPESNSRPHHVLLVADPQIVDQRSYPHRFAPIAYLTRLLVDLNMRKNWQAALRKQPDTIVFLGDVMDNGRLDMSDDEYEALFGRFRSIFKMKNDIPVYHIPGNHDIGLGNVRSFKVSPKAHERYVSHFGAPNNEASIANHTLVFFDAPKFVDEDLKRHGQRMSVKGWRPIQGGSWAFLKNFSKQEHMDPVVLFSHIPLFRPDGKNCGPLRERGTIRPGAGEGYQNTLEKQSTSLLLDVVNPVAIFSGDDHDYCEYFHQIQPAEGDVRTIREVTIRSLSMVMNVKRPGFQLLSLAPAELRRAAHEPSYVDKPCLLPDQIQIYLERYLPLIIITFLVVFFSIISGLGLPAPGRSLFPTLMKEDSSSDPDEELSSPPRYTSQPSSPKTYQLRNHRSLRGRGWAMFQAAATRREPQPFSHFPNLFDTLRAYCPRFVSAISLRRRRLWVRCLRDIRDIAIFPIIAFVLVTWWVVS